MSKINISTCVGVLNNLDYTKHFYKTFRAIYPTEELVFVSYGSTDGTHEWLQDLIFQDKNVIGFFDKDKKTFSDTYNKCVELATKQFVVFAHNDMVVAPNFLENLEKYAHKDRVVSYTTYEPPIFKDHSRPGKVIIDFGVDLETFSKRFYDFASQEIITYKDGISEGISFFMCLSRDVFLEMGGFDNIFNPYFLEDYDFIRRLKLKGLECFNSLDSIVYHFVSKTSRFSEEARLNTQRIEQNSNRTYLRKWGSMNSNNRYNIAFDVENCTEQLLEVLEPWCSKIFINYKFADFGYEYITKEQPNTSFDLYDRVVSCDTEQNSDVIVSFDASKLNQNNFEIIRNLQDILSGTVEGEKYESDMFSIQVNSLNNTIKDLVIKK